jgi:hypothetical protein
MLTPKTWNESNPLLQAVAEYRIQVTDLYECIMNTPGDWDVTTTNETAVLLPNFTYI